MKYKSGLLAGLIIITTALQAQIVNKTPLSDRMTGYRISAVLNTEAKTVSCTMNAFWVNRSSDLVPDIQMHLYMNAFRSNRTTFYRESGGSPGSREKDPGWIEISSLTDGAGNDLMPLIEYISPDDGNSDDRTVMRVLLPEPAKPGDSVFIEAAFETKLPSFINRTGFADDFYFVAQWFPKFGVYEPAGMRYAVKGGWNCHQFHNNSEFYSNHSVYDVDITVPAEYITGSGGMLMSEIISGEHKHLRYRAEDIVDFAWTAWTGYAVINDTWNHVNITLLMPKDRIWQAKRQFTAVKNALEYFNENVGPYPWPHLTFVDPPAKGQGAGGMEYTTLFTSASAFIIPEWFRMPELTTIHEFGHAYFMGILASNEFEEPWLDEGVNTFWEGRIVDHYYGAESGILDHPLLKIPDKVLIRQEYIRSSSRQVTSNAMNSWSYPHGTYYMMSYQKAATWLYTLMGLVGEETINDIFREYYIRWAFRHPSGKDFIAVVNDVVRQNHGDRFGPDMNWFFDQTLFGTGICDYKVSDISNRRHRKPVGKTVMVDTVSTDRTGTDSLYTSVASLERIGEIMLPVDVLVRFDNGDEILEKWEGKARYIDFTYTGYRKIEWVKIDPEFRITMDVNYINNSMTVKPDHAPVKRLTGRFMAFIQFYLSYLLL